MTPHEKALNAINARLERLQTTLRDAKVESAQRFLFQSLVITVAAAETLNDYVKMVGQYAQARHAEARQTNEALGAQHADLLKLGKELLEKLKAEPTDRAIRKEIESAQQKMEGIQKELRRGANALQRKLAPSLAMIDEMAVSVRRLSEAETIDALRRLLKNVIGQVREFCAAQTIAAAKGVVDAEAWEKSAGAEIDQAADFYDAYARTGYQLGLALELMAMVISDRPPQSAEEATQRANDAVAARVKDITGRITSG